jgi:hypothetical protein
MKSGLADFVLPFFMNGEWSMVNSFPKQSPRLRSVSWPYPFDPSTPLRTLRVYFNRITVKKHGIFPP